MVPANFLPRLNLAPSRDGPMEKGIEASDAFAIGQGFDMFEKGGETADDLSLIQVFGDFKESFERHLCFRGARRPDIFGEFFRFKFAFKGHQDTPLEFIELHDVYFHGISRDIGFAAGFGSAAADMSDPEDEQTLRGHDPEMIGADFI